MKSIPLTAKQQQQVRQYEEAIQSIQRQEGVYLKCVMDGHDMADGNWKLNPECTALVLVTDDQK